MTEKEYRSHPAISRSELWRMHESPEKFKWFKDHPPEPTKALLFGQVVHKLLLEPDTFDAEFAVAPDVNRTTKAGKEHWAAFIETVGDRAIVPADVYTTCSDMAVAAMQNDIVRKLLNGEHELPLFWTDEDTGEQCKCRLDCLTEYDGEITIVDYKSASNAATHDFNRKIFSYGYNLQSGMYSEGAMKALDLPKRPRFIFIVQEKKPPYSINVVTVTDEVMLNGVDKFRELIGTYHECKTLGYWPGYLGFFNEPNEAYLLEWAKDDVESEDD